MLKDTKSLGNNKVRTKMYLCHITLLMLKDTKSLGNNKASAWESRGVVIKKEGMHFDTPSLILGVFQPQI